MVNYFNYIIEIFNLFLLFCIFIYYNLIYYLGFIEINNYYIILCKKLYNFNILYAKIFQILAINDNCVNNELGYNLLEFTNNVPYDNNSLNIKELDKFLQYYGLELEDSYDKPINSGIISLIYKCYKKTQNIVNSNLEMNKPYIIKIKRNNIEEKINKGINNIRFILSLINYFYNYHSFDLINSFEKNIDILKKQLDFKEEVNSNKVILNSCKILDYIIIPRYYEEVTEEFNNIILMDYINGIKINELITNDYNIYAKLIIKYAFISCFKYGVCHGDLHPGNILFIKNLKENQKTFKILPFTNMKQKNVKDNENNIIEEYYDYKIALLDYGIIHNFSKEFQDFLTEFFTSVFLLPSYETSKLVMSSCIFKPLLTSENISNENYNYLFTHINNVINETFIKNKDMKLNEMCNFMNKLNQLTNNFNLNSSNYYNNNLVNNNIKIEINDDFTKFRLVLTMCSGIFNKLCFNNIMPILNEVIDKIIDSNEL